MQARTKNKIVNIVMKYVVPVIILGGLILSLWMAYRLPEDKRIQYSDMLFQTDEQSLEAECKRCKKICGWL